MATPVSTSLITPETSILPTGAAVVDTGSPFLGALTSLHAVFRLAGNTGNDLLTASEKVLRYVVSVLRDETPDVPDATPAEWRVLLALLKTHWILPLLYWKIGHLPRSAHPPEEMYGMLRSAFLTTRAHSLKAGIFLQEIMRAFAAENISVIVMKGPALAFSVYPDPAARPFDDIDLLVMPEHFVNARGVLVSLGFIPGFNRFELLRELQCEEQFSPPPDSPHGLNAELHWNPLKSFGVRRADTLQSLFERARRVETPAGSFSTLHPIDALILHAQHMILHHAQDIRLSWLYDVSLLAGCIAAGSAWDELKNRSRDMCGVRAVEYALQLACCWTGLRLPAGADNFAAWPEPCPEERVVIKKALVYKRNAGTMLGQFLAGAASLSDKIRLLGKLIFPGREYLNRNHPCASRWLLPVSCISYWMSWFRKVFCSR